MRRALTLLISLITLGTFFGSPAVTAQTTEHVRVEYEGVIYELDHVAYDEPLVLDYSQATGKRDTPYETLLSYYSTMKNMDDYGELLPFLCLADGSPGNPPPPADLPKIMADTAEILAGDTLIFGEVLFEEYTIYIYRYEKSIPRNLGLPIKQFGDAYCVVQDLVVANPIVNRMSASRWDVEQLEARYPAPPAPPEEPEETEETTTAAAPSPQAGEPAGEPARSRGPLWLMLIGALVLLIALGVVWYRGKR